MQLTAFVFHKHYTEEKKIKLFLILWSKIKSSPNLNYKKLQHHYYHAQVLFNILTNFQYKNS